MLFRSAHLDVSQFPNDLLVTADFARTVQLSGAGYVSDAYHRPVQWILTGTGAWNLNTVKHMVIISPFEAEELLPFVKLFRKVTLHLYAPRCRLESRSLDALDLFTEGRSFDPRNVPRHLTVLLNLFAGQLYLRSFQEYVDLCDFLGLEWKAADGGVSTSADGLVTPTPRKKGFTNSPVGFLKVFLTKTRRNCEGIEKTHLGKILNGELLEEADFDL